jgi:hypothetical protein
MVRKSLGVCFSLALAISFAAAGSTAWSQAKLSAADIVDKNVAARGGLPAWRAVQTMSMEGKMGAGGNQRATASMPIPDKKASKQSLPSRPAEEGQLPFIMYLERPAKMRLELQFQGQTAIQVFDGVNGWKVRPYLNRREVEPYAPDELKSASREAGLDGYLIDYAAKGTKIESEGTEKVEGRDTYKLKLTLKNGDVKHVWVDAQTFLETKISGEPRRLDGIDHPVEVYYRDYRAISGLQIPFTLETRVLPAAQGSRKVKPTPIPPEKINIQKAVVNPKLAETLFSKPELGAAAKPN